MIRVAVFTGHSGGHLFPAAAFAETLKERFPQIWIGLVTSRKAEGLVAKLPGGLFDQVDYFPDFPLALRLNIKSFQYIFRFLQSFLLAFAYFKRNRVELCAGFGSYISFPGVLTARFLKIPTLIHEQNLVPGKATRMLVRRADVVAVSFEKTFEGLPSRIVTGLPLRRRLTQFKVVGLDSEAAREAHFLRSENAHECAARDTQPDIQFRGPSVAAEQGQGPSRLFQILIVGGSQGAHRLNEIILETFSRLLPEEKQKVAVKHVTGKQDFDWVSKKYGELGIQAETFPFFDSMEQLYSKANMAITRAGANTLFELAQFNLPAIVVPYPHADAHQHANAEYFERRGALILKDEQTLTPEELLGQIRRLKNNPDELRRFSNALAGISSPDAGALLADAAERLAMKGKKICLSSTPI